MAQLDPAMTRSTRPAPRFLALWQIRFPIGAIASIGHRLSGIALLVALPLLALGLDRSLRSRDDYDALLAGAHSPWMAPVVFVALWAACYHVLAGVRHLLMDVGAGWKLPQARTSAWGAIVAAPVLAGMLTLWWFA